MSKIFSSLREIFNCVHSFIFLLSVYWKYFNKYLVFLANRIERECANRRYVFERHPRKKLKLSLTDIKEVSAANRTDCEDRYYIHYIQRLKINVRREGNNIFSFFFLSQVPQRVQFRLPIGDIRHRPEKLFSQSFHQKNAPWVTRGRSKFWLLGKYLPQWYIFNIKHFCIRYLHTTFALTWKIFVDVKYIFIY